MKILILRGIPGSGKTTWWQKHFPEAAVCSADDYRMVDGVYRFDPADDAHPRCARKYLALLQGQAVGEAPAVVVVDNTNILAAEIAFYYQLAEVLGHPPVVITFLCNGVVATKRNAHGVPAHQIGRIAEALWRERLPSWWHCFEPDVYLAMIQGEGTVPQAPERPEASVRQLLGALSDVQGWAEDGLRALDEQQLKTAVRCLKKIVHQCGHELPG